MRIYRRDCGRGNRFTFPPSKMAPSRIRKKRRARSNRVSLVFSAPRREAALFPSMSSCLPGVFYRLIAPQIMQNTSITAARMAQRPARREYFRPASRAESESSLRAASPPFIPTRNWKNTVSTANQAQTVPASPSWSARILQQVERNRQHDEYNRNAGGDLAQGRRMPCAFLEPKKVSAPPAMVPTGPEDVPSCSRMVTIRNRHASTSMTLMTMCMVSIAFLKPPLLFE